MQTPVVFSWSSGKDSAFALWRLRQDDSFEVRALLTTLTDGFDRVSMHGVREELLDQQAEAIGLPLYKVRIPPDCSNELYEELMDAALGSADLREIDHYAFADLFLADLRAYREARLAAVGKKALFRCGGSTPTSSRAA